MIGSSNALAYADDEHGEGAILRYQEAMEFFDDGPVKPVRIWSRIGQRPILAGGNSNGDIPMLRYAGQADPRAGAGLLLNHDDARPGVRLHGRRRGVAPAGPRRTEWTVVSMKDDWSAVFAEHPD